MGIARATSQRVEAEPASALASPTVAPWLFGPASDLLLGCGGLYLLVIGVLLVVGPTVRVLQPEFVFAFGILFLSAPHYGATLLRVYERRQDRRSYWLFSVWSSLAILVLFVAGLYLPAIGTLLFTLYLTWSPWIRPELWLALMFLRQAPRWEGLNRLILRIRVGLRALLPCGDGAAGAQDTLIGRDLGAPAGAVLFVPLGIPVALVNALLPAVALAYAATLMAAGVLLWRRAASPRYLVPVALLALTQALWFSVPYLLRWLQRGSSLDPFDPHSYGYYLMWLVIGHGVQYLWVTSYFALHTGQSRSLVTYYGKATLAGAGLCFLPGCCSAGRPGPRREPSRPALPRGRFLAGARSRDHLHHSCWTARSGSPEPRTPRCCPAFPLGAAAPPRPCSPSGVERGVRRPRDRAARRGGRPSCPAARAPHGFCAQRACGRPGLDRTAWRARGSSCVRADALGQPTRRCALRRSIRSSDGKAFLAWALAQRAGTSRAPGSITTGLGPASTTRDGATMVEAARCIVA